MAPPRSYRVCLVVFLTTIGFHSALSSKSYLCHQDHPISLLEGSTSNIIVPYGICGSDVRFDQLRQSPDVYVKHLNPNATYTVFLLKDEKNMAYDIMWQLGHAKPYGDILTHNKTRQPLIMYTPPTNASANYTVLVYEEYNSTADVRVPNHSLFNPTYWAKVASLELTSKTNFQIVAQAEPSPTPRLASTTKPATVATTRSSTPTTPQVTNSTTPKTGKSSAVQLLSSFPVVALTFAYLTKALMF